MPTSSVVPLAITSFLAVVTGAVPAGTGVYDGEPRTGQDVPQSVTVIGWETTSREPAAFGLGAGAGSFSIEEQFVLTAALICYDGAEDQATSRAAAFALFDLIESAVRADPTLGTGGGTNAVRAAWISQLAGRQGAANNGGTYTQIDFELHVEARVQ